jgi:hypothetical protein
VSLIPRRLTLWIGASAAVLIAALLFLIFDANGQAPQPSQVGQANVQKKQPAAADSSGATSARQTGDAKAGKAGAKRPGDKKEHPLDPALAIAYEGLANIRETLVDYTTIMKKRERVDGVLVEQKIFAKVRCRQKEGEKTIVPMSVYVKVLEPKSQAGREAIWVENRNEGKIVAHGTGLQGLFRVHLRPRGYFAMMGTRYPITEIGLDNMVEQLIEKGERDRQRGECEVEFIKNVDVGGRSCTRIVVTHPVKRDYFDFHIAEIYIDDERNVPLRYNAYTWPKTTGGDPVLEEEVIYTDLKLNVGLAEKDFDPDNKEYNYP